MAILFDQRQVVDGLVLLREIEDSQAATAFFDPQHRPLLDQMKYGNEGKRQRGRSMLPVMSESMIARFLAEIGRVLRPSGHCFLWIDKFCLASGRHLAWIEDAPMLTLVDMIAWHKARWGMGKRARCATEFALVLQKLPARAQGCWTDHAIPDCWTEQQDRQIHPHAKPAQLTERLIRATTKRRELVIDPCAGGYGVLRACVDTGRTFAGCDIVTEEAWQDRSNPKK